jgi:hypothetical protein
VPDTTARADLEALLSAGKLKADRITVEQVHWSGRDLTSATAVVHGGLDSDAQMPIAAFSRVFRRFKRLQMVAFTDGRLAPPRQLTTPSGSPIGVETRGSVITFSIPPRAAPDLALPSPLLRATPVPTTSNRAPLLQMAGVAFLAMAVVVGVMAALLYARAGSASAPGAPTAGPTALREHARPR